jgi:hypothetical protein
VFRFCFERGYLLQSSAKGDYGKIDSYPRRPHDELWTEDMEPLPVPDWRRFRDVWKTSLPKLRIRNPCEDTCPECFILKNKFRYLGNRRNDQDDVSVANAQELPEDFAADEALLFNANLHAEQAQQQRNLAAERQQLAMEEALNAHGDRRFVLTFFPPFYYLHVVLTYLVLPFFQLLYGM